MYEYMGGYEKTHPVNFLPGKPRWNFPPGHSPNHVFRAGVVRTDAQDIKPVLPTG